MMLENSPPKKLSKREFYGYAVGFVGPITLLSLVGVLLNLYYIYVIGLDPILSGIGLAIGHLTYSIFALIWGNISDNSKGKTARKYGKRHLFMGIALVPMVVVFFLLWVPPVKAIVVGEQNWAVAAWLWGTSFLFHFFFSAFSPSYWALMPEISHDEDERVHLSIIQNLMSLVGTIASILVPILLLSGAEWNQSLFWAAGGGTDTVGLGIIAQMTLFSLLLVGVTVTSVSITLKTVREPLFADKPAARISMGQFFRGIFAPLKQNRDFTKWQVANFVMNLGSSILLLDIMVFVRTVLKLEGIEWFIFVVVVVPAGGGAFVLFDKLKKKLGLKQVFVETILFAAVVLVLASVFFVDFAEDVSFWLGLVFMCFGIMAIVGMMIFPNPVNAAFIDKGCALTGVSHSELSGKYSGIYLFFLYLSSSLASLVYTAILDALGADNRVAIVLVLPVAGLCMFVGFLLFRKADLSIPEKRA